MRFNQLREIIEKYNSGNCTDEEREFLENWYSSFEWKKENKSMSKEQVQALRDTMWSGIKTKTGIVFPGKLIKHPAVKNRGNNGSASWWYMAAASLIIGFIAVGIFYINHKKTGLASHIILQKKDVAPGGEKALLTLADGSVIPLDSTKKGQVIKQGTVTIAKTGDGLIAYNIAKEDKQQVTYNTISTPRGGKYQVLLPDGSNVWLNAASSIRFPVQFTGSERKVEITGEAYFEVTKNRRKPFKVEIIMPSGNKGEVEVFGTHFNIMAYDNEESIKTTLLEGSVKISNAKSSLEIIPGQQAVINNVSGGVTLKKDIDVDETIAWKNDKFIFQDEDIKAIMRQLERWYDVKATYTNTDDDEEFVGIISRNVNISQILQMLEKTGTVSFEINGKNIIVTREK